MTDNDLDSLIRHSLPKPALPASFQRDVWARIAVNEENTLASRWSNLCESAFMFFARPATAVAMVMGMLLVGAGLGTMAASGGGTNARLDAYIASISPVSAAHTGTHQ